jgi:hypothetical protein
MTKEQDEIKRKKAEGWYFNENGILVPPKHSEERIAESDVKNRRLLPSYVPQEEERTKEDDDIVKYATAEDIDGIKKILNKIVAILEVIKKSLTKKRGD